MNEGHPVTRRIQRRRMAFETGSEWHDNTSALLTNQAPKTAPARGYPRPRARFVVDSS